MKKKLIVLAGLGLFVPFLAFAQTTIQDMVGTATTIISTVLPFLMILAVVFFIWGVIMYVIGADEEAKKKGKDKMIYGLIGLVVIVGVWGLVAIIANTFDIGVGGGSQNVTAPCVPGTAGC